MELLGQLLLAAAGGGLVVKLLDIVYAEYKKRRDDTANTGQLLEKHLDPVLKAADEVVGKVRALAERDFKDMSPVGDLRGRVFLDNRALASAVYLFAAFWCRLELFRQDSVYVELARDERGIILKKFMDCLESRKIRIIDRISQRAIGEVFVDQGQSRRAPKPYVGVARLYDTDPHVQAWIDLCMTLFRAAETDKEIRQKILVYGIILHAMIDTLDPNHEATKDRPSFANKLSTKSKRDLKFRVFKVYVKGVKGAEKYYGEGGGK